MGHDSFNGFEPVESYLKPTFTMNMFDNYQQQQQQQQQHSTMTKSINSSSSTSSIQSVDSTSSSTTVSKGDPLTRYESAEVTQCFGKVYYLPEKRPTPKGCKNLGFDSDNNRYITEPNDHFAYRYQVIKKLGHGAFGDCYKVYDHKEHQEVALKVIRNERRFVNQARLEVKILKQLQPIADEHCAVKYIDSFMFRNHMCITFELHKRDLYSELVAREFIGFSVPEAAVAIRDILKCLTKLRDNRIVHADLKPENVLLQGGGTSKSGNVVVIDFGSSAYESSRIQTYVQSRYYRAPEIVLGHKSGCPIDMWSVGCILYELITGKPLFHARSERDLLLFQMELCGTVPISVLKEATRTNEFFVSTNNIYCPKKLTDRRGKTRIPGSRNIAASLPVQDDNLVDFILQCVNLDPSKRMDPYEALRHPYIISNTHPDPGSVSSLMASGKYKSSESIDSGLEMSPPKLKK